MARYYSTKSFFRNAPNKLFGRYFKDRQLLYDLDFTSMKEGNPETLFAAWLELPDEYKKILMLIFKRFLRSVVKKE